MDKIDKVRWRAEVGGEYFSVEGNGFVYDNIDERRVFDNVRYDIGNYFRTEEEAKESAIYKAYLR